MPRIKPNPSTNGAAKSTAVQGTSVPSDGQSITPVVLRAASELVSRYQFARTHGLQFGGDRDLYDTLGYDDDHKLTTEKFRHAYRRGDIASRIVRIYPESTWGEGADVIEDPDPGIETAFEKAVLDLFDKLDIWSKILRADVLSQLGEYSILLIGVPMLAGSDEQANMELSEPLDTAPDISYIKPFADDRAEIHSEVMDPGDERYGEPEFYQVKFGSGRSVTSKGRRVTQSAKVHYSRVIHVVESPLEDETYGEPRLRAIWNLLYNLDKLIGGGSEAAWRHMDPFTQWDLDPQAAIELDATGKKELEDMFEEAVHGLKKNVRTSGIDINQLRASVVNFGPNVDTIIQIISATTGIPYRILTGSERGELASTQDRNNFNDRISFRREKFAVPLLKSIVDRFIDLGVLPEPREYEVRWPEVEELDEKEKSEVVASLANANKRQSEAGDGVIVYSNEIRENVLNLGPREEVEGLNIDSMSNDEGGEDNSEDDDNNDKDLNVNKLLRSSDSNDSSSDNTPRRIVIVGGPRRGKSTLAKQLRDEHNIPTYCTETRSQCKNPEDGVTYIPDEYKDWSTSSEYVANNWLTQPGPWCVEGIGSVRALRKALKSNDQASLYGVEVIVLANAHPNAEISDKQESTAKAVNTIWNGIADSFPQARVVSNRVSKSSVRSKSDLVVPRKLRHSQGIKGRKRISFAVSR